MVTEIRKEGSNIILVVREHDTPVKFDCKEKQIYSFTGRVVKALPKCATESRDPLARYIIHALKHTDEYWRRIELSPIEPFLTYPDRIDIRSIPSECPKGYIKYIVDHDLKFTRETLNDFKFFAQIKNLPPQDKELYTTLLGMMDSVWDKQKIRELTEKELRVVIKIIRVSMKKFYYNFRNNLMEFFTVIDDYGHDVWTEFINTDRDIVFNTNTLIDQKNAVLDRLINQREVALDFLQDITLDGYEDFVIRVPHSVKDLQDEGTQQQNCVGHYYNDSVVAGRNLIFFIRHTDAPDKSYITCRYSIPAHSVPEYRLKCNYCVSDEREHDFVKRIGELITEHLKAGA